MPVNTTPDTALAIGSLPYSITQDPTGGADSTFLPSCDFTGKTPLWYTYTPPPGVTAIGIGFQPSNPAADYFPALSGWTGTPPALTQVAAWCWQWSNATPIEYLVQLAVTPGVTYYFQVANWNFGVITTLSNLEFRAEPAPNNATPSGSFLISNDTDNFPSTVLSGVDGSLLRTFGFPAFEQASMLPNGTFLVAAIDSNYNTVAFNIYDASLNLVTAITSIVVANQYEFNGVTNDGTNFYVVCGQWSFSGANGATLYRIAPDGTVGSSWTLPAPAGSSSALAVSAAGIAYWMIESGGQAYKIRRFDLNSNAALADLVTDAGTVHFGRDLELTADGDLLAIARDGSNVVTVRRYSTVDGSLLATYTPTAWLGTLGTPRFRIDPNDPTRFIVMSATSQTSTTGTSTFDRFVIADGTHTVLFAVPFRDDNGGYAQTPMFAMSQSCPMFFLPSGGGGGGVLRLTQLPIEAAYGYPLLQPVQSGDAATAWTTPPAVPSRRGR